MSVGQEFRGARLGAGKTQEEVAFAAGIDRAYLSQLENDHTSPTLDVFLRVCRAIGVPAAEVVA